MSKIFCDVDKFESESPSSVVTAINTAVQTVVRQRFEASGQNWKDFVFGESLETITEEDFRAVERMLIDAGHRYDWSAAISPQERPDAYKPAVGTSEDDLDTFCFEDPDAPVGEPGSDGLETAWRRRQRGELLRGHRRRRPLRALHQPGTEMVGRRRAGEHHSGDRRLRRHAHRAHSGAVQGRDLRRRHRAFATWAFSPASTAFPA